MKALEASIAPPFSDSVPGFFPRLRLRVELDFGGMLTLRIGINIVASQVLAAAEY